MSRKYDDAVILFDLICRFSALVSFSDEETIATLQAKLDAAGLSSEQLATTRKLISLFLES